MQRLSQAVEWIGAELIGHDCAVTGACIDTRALQAGQLFVALPGEKVDGHDFVSRAAALGASGALVSRRVDIDFPQLLVADVLQALQQLAVAWRSEWAQMSGGKIAAITGSNGKTSVKTMLANILARSHQVYATPGNFNNHIGLPLSLLNVRAEHQMAVLEMGANHAGEIAQLAAWTAPDCGVVTQAGDAHLEGFGGRDQVALAKGEMFAALSPQGTAIINADDAYFELWQSIAAHTSVLSFGRAAQAQVRALDESNGPQIQDFKIQLADGQWPVSLPMPGRHSVMNALAAAAAAQALGVGSQDIIKGLSDMQAVAGRLQPSRLPCGAQLIDDSYNANPASFRAALDVLVASSTPRHLVLGDMAELGEAAPRLHREAGAAVAASGIEHFWTCGPLSELAARTCREQSDAVQVQHFPDRASLAFELLASLDAQGTVLLKGSRSAGMEHVAHYLQRGQ
jgi:UDP-N-acetylmuramoyl-tripeptide--D-alanyl-D-alanine ligase